MLSQETSSTANEYSKQSNVAPVSGNHSVPIWEVPESELKPFSNGDAAIKTTLKLLENTEWLVSLSVVRKGRLGRNYKVCFALTSNKLI